MEWTRSFFTSAPAPAAADPPPPPPDPQGSLHDADNKPSNPYKRLRPDAKNVARRLALRRELGRRLPAGLQETPKTLARLPERHRVHGYVVALNKGTFLLSFTAGKLELQVSLPLSLLLTFIFISFLPPSLPPSFPSLAAHSPRRLRGRQVFLCSLSLLRHL